LKTISLLKEISDMRKKNLLVSLAVSAAFMAPLAAHADAGDTTIGGVAFIDFTSVNSKNSGTDVDPNGFGLDVKRGYLVVNHSFDDVWSANLTTDFNFASYKNSCSVSGGATGETCSVSTTTPETQLFVKKLYLQGKFSDSLVLRIGSAETPWIPYAEGVYGYRFVENTLIDRNGVLGGYKSFGNSADWGVNLNGDGGMWNYSASILNGNGYKNPSRSKTMDFEGRLGFVPVDGLIIGIGYYTGDLGQDTEAAEAANVGVSKNTANRTDALVAWKASGLTVGLEYFTADNFGSKLIFSNNTDKADGYSVYGSYDFPGTQFGVFGRYDNVKPSKDVDSSLQDKYYNAGFAIKTSPSITWALAYKSEKLTDSAGVDLKDNEFGVWAQFKY
jgi:hypothetical protein